ncbi:benzoate-CoA ligase family protein [Actinomycetospora straminea]|uniref:Benzoate-CoA ligase family protein n=1 Tax=Actinomycetospora straminea TaxID=663607 RepID=A0ABP9EIY4_9PSEU|nr:benzoate-CoA ligase family protein [Actinomycetospora straminea]MDD7933371.1 benzoate-CoA ligase family protein [Actinomycetospora straminea]
MAESFNAADYLVGRRIAAGDGDREAVRAPSRSLTYAELDAEIGRVAAGLAALGVQPEQRVVLCMVDEVELFAGILATMRLGAIAVPVSTMLRGSELAVLVADSRSRLLLCSATFADTSRAAVLAARERGGDVAEVVVTGDDASGFGADVAARTWDEMLAAGDALGGAPPAYDTWDESQALWLYTSGTTGKPKAAMHRHADIRFVCETYGQQVLGIRPDDLCLSVAKLFFAYGIGNSMFFPLSVGAAAVLEPSRPTPALLAELASRHRVTMFFGTPSSFGPLLAAAESGQVDPAAFASVRRGVSAGEALPARMVEGMGSVFGIEVLDGIGSTEALHIYLSNRPGEVVPGTSGVPVPGYDVEIRGTGGSPVPDGETGTLYVRGDSICTGYWCRTATNRLVFEGEWLRTGDTYVRNPDGTYTCLGRTDDVLKVGGIWVTPSEVEERLVAHPSVAEVVVVAVQDADGLDLPVACVVPREGHSVDPEALIAWCREGLASFKRPRHVIEIGEIPRTATGKVQRFRLRELAAELVASPAATPAATLEGAH